MLQVRIFSHVKDATTGDWNNIEDQKRFCPEEESKCGLQTIKWKTTPVNTTTLPEKPYLDIDQSIVKRYCQFSFDSPTWSTLETDCTEVDLGSTVTKDLYSYLKRIYNDTTVDITSLTKFYKRISEFEVIDFVILFECIQHIPEELFPKLRMLVNMMSELKDKDSAYISDKIAEAISDNLNKYISNPIITSTSVYSPNIYVTAWKPFSNGVVGVALYNLVKNFVNSSIIDIYANQTLDDINTKTLEVAAYFPYTFLQSLVQGLADIEKKKMYVVMWFIKGDIFTQWYLELEADMGITVGVSIPKFCKKNNQSMLRVFFRTSDKVLVPEWKDFGAEYLDSSSNPQYTCVLSQMSYFGYCSSNYSLPQGYYESVKETYCMATTIKTTAGEMIMEQTPVTTITYPNNFCIGNTTKIPKLFCLPNGNFKVLPLSDTECTTDHPISKYTYSMYKMATGCWNINETLIEQTFVANNNLSYVDKMFLFDIIWCIFEHKLYNSVVYADHELISNLFDKTYGINDEIPEKYFDLPYVFYPLAFYQFLTDLDVNRTDVYLLIKPNFIYFLAFPFANDIIGLVLYNNNNASSFLSYELKYLTRKNVSQDLSLDDSIELILHISLDSLNDKHLKKLSIEEKSSIQMSASILYKYEFLEAKYRARSRVIAFDSVSSNAINISVDAYLRTMELDYPGVNYVKPNGYWFSVRPNKAVVTLVFVSVHKSRACEGTDRVTTLHVTKGEQQKSFYKKVKKRKEVHDIISQVSMSVNYANSERNIEKLYYRHSWILQLLMNVGGILSCLGLLIIFLSVFLFNNWYKKRFCSVQLTIALACQNIYFIINTSNVSAASYMIFYYSILAQFTWMSIIGYTQYIKFIRVFKESELNVWKFLILGWLIPALITLVSVIIYKDCFSCNFCIKSSNIFMYFVITPICLVFVINLIIYVFILINISRSKWHQQSATVRSSKRRAVILLAFMLGISWIFIFALISPWTWLTLVGCYLFHIIAPSQGFILFIFIIILDKHSRSEWTTFLNIRARIEHFSSTYSKYWTSSSN